MPGVGQVTRVSTEYKLVSRETKPDNTVIDVRGVGWGAYVFGRPGYLQAQWQRLLPMIESGAVTALECLKYALRLPTSVVITGIDKPEYIDQACEAARTYQQMSDGDVAALLASSAATARLEVPSRMWASCDLERPSAGTRVLVAMNPASDILLVPLTPGYAERLRAHIGKRP
jgi:hypothetical protein